MRAKITKRQVDALRSREGRDACLWDSEVTGFGVRCRGGQKVYILKYGTGRSGRSRKLTIGPHGSPWTVESAREEAKRLQGRIADGDDPAAARAAARKMPTIEWLAKTYITKHAELHKRPNSVEGDRYMLTRSGIADVKPRVKTDLHAGQAGTKVTLEPIARLRIDKVQRSDVAALHFKRRDKPTDANRLLALLSKMFSLAEVWGLRSPGSNPCKGIRRYRENRRERFLSEAELARLGATLVAFERPAEKKRPLVDPFAIAAIRLLIFTGARASEIKTARWENVNLEAGVLRVPLPKEGTPKNIRLAPPALSVLKVLPRLAGNPYVIAGRLPGTHLTDLEKPWQRIRKAADLEDVRLHDLRHGWASIAAAGGASLPILGAVLGHSQPTTTQRYAHFSEDPLRGVVDQTARKIESALNRDVVKRIDNVVKLGRG
ncbi:MAG: site-specific integrase [Vicinamibacteria bacterium]|nr:site-specific integrase [Vicinamibacteria bacterium]